MTTATEQAFEKQVKISGDVGDLKNLSDEDIFSASLKNPVLFEILVNRYKKAFLRKVYPVVASIGGISTAEDVVQEAFVKIYIKGNSFVSRGKGSFRSWSYAILMNTCFSAYRKAKREAFVSIDENLEAYATIPDAHLAEEEDRKMSIDFVLSLLSRLPETLRRTAELYYVKGKSHREIALVENTSEGTIRTRVHRAKMTIKRFTDKTFGYDDIVR